MSGFNDFMNKAGAFASKAAEKAKDAAVAAAAKTKQLSRIAKLNMDISGQKDTVRKAYAELGKLYYEAHHDDPEQAMAQVCQQIDMANAAIAALEEEIASLKAAEDEEAVDADFASVVDETEADVEVEIQEEPIAEEPAAEEPAAEESAAEEPVAEEPVAEEPVVEESVVEEPVAEEPAAEEPVAEEPVAEEPHWD